MQALRAALGNGLHLDNARAIIVACDNLLKNDDLSNPIVVLAIRLSSRISPTHALAGSQSTPTRATRKTGYC